MGSFDLYYLGGEQAGWRSVLRANGVTTLGVSYWSLRKRLPKKRGFNLAAMFEGFDRVLLESGGFQANESPEQLTLGEWETYAAEYENFVVKYAEHFTLITEFDALVLGDPWVNRRRLQFYSQFQDKFLPVWHPMTGPENLPQLAEFSGRISIVSSVVVQPGFTAETALRTLASRGVKLHGSALTKPEIIEQIPFTSAASSSWLSPTKYHGDTIVWDNRTRELKRFPLSQKNRARVRYAAYFREHGFDPDAILADDNGEVTRLTVWSWQQWAGFVAASRDSSLPGQDSNSVGVDVSGENLEIDAPDVAVLPSEAVPARGRELVPRETRQLPVFVIRHEANEDESAGEGTQITTLAAAGQSQRVCDSCHLRDKCPAFSPGATCAYSLPVELRTKQQLRAMLAAVLEMQTQRVAFGRFVEERSGGYPDANISAEMDRLFKLAQIKHEIEDDADKFEMTVRGRASNSGVMSRYFGAQVGAATSALENPVPPEETDKIIEGMLG